MSREGYLSLAARTFRKIGGCDSPKWRNLEKSTR